MRKRFDMTGMDVVTRRDYTIAPFTPLLTARISTSLQLGLVHRYPIPLIPPLKPMHRLSLHHPGIRPVPPPAMQSSSSNGIENVLQFPNNSIRTENRRPILIKQQIIPHARRQPFFAKYQSGTSALDDADGFFAQRADVLESRQHGGVGVGVGRVDMGERRENDDAVGIGVDVGKGGEGEVHRVLPLSVSLLLSIVSLWAVMLYWRAF